MADPYIDQYETLIYGKFAREQMHEVCLGKRKQLDGMVQFAISAQEKADEDMKAVLDRQPRPAPDLDAPAVLEEARDTIVRFGSHLDSLKGRPVDPKLFFRGEAPSVLARRRLTKLSAAVGNIVAEIKTNKDKIRDAKLWLSEFEEVRGKLETVERAQRAKKVEKVDLGPEVAAAREAWLGIYGANKNLIRGLLGHVGKPELLPLIFDDLAEVHRVSGVSDEVVSPPAEPGASPA
ncbi:MAG: hypothetical protein ABI193_23660 [Minicystis sp.]